MASGSVRPATSSLEGSASADKLIDAQLGRVRRHIRITDLIAGIMALFAGVFAFLIVVAIVDHWILGLGVVGRVLALGALLAGAGWHLTMNVVPLLVRKINPAYAAQTIERGGPNLKNSLLNYLLLRRQSAGMHAVVFQAVQQRAAADVSRVEVEQTVDRSTLIRAGYVLAGVMVIAAAYKILSPKDPFQTVRRIAAPWSDIARPARVTIEGVEPGNAEVIQGHSVDVSVLVRGERATDEVRLIFSSLDGQIVDQSVLMKPDSAGLRHLLAFPPGGSGVQQDYIYRISAGDAVTTTYRLRSVPAPTMTIESVQYEFPAYTQRAREVVERVGDLKAVEGTRVTVRGKANQPIRNATIEFMSVAGTGKNSAPNERVPMQFREREAWFSWTLQLANDRQTPKHSAYQATFVNQSGLASRDPVLHRIEVVPDLSPEVEILTPNKDMVQVPVHGQQKIEIRAIDPDFGLSNVRLKAVCAGQEILNEPLFENTPGQMGQVVVEYKFRPSALQLSAGSQVSYWAEASDNRQSDGSPQPNITQTPRRTLAIIDDPAGQPRSPEQKSDAVEKPGENGSPSPPEKTPDGDKSKQSGSREKSDNDKQSSEQEQTKNNQKSQDQPSSGSQEGSEQKSGKQSSDSKQGGSAGKGNSEAGEGQSGQKQGGESSKSDQPSPSEPGQGSSAQQKGGDTPQQNRPENSDTTPGNGPNATGESRDGGNSGQRTEPLHDGEAFEKALERLKQKPNDPNQDSPSESPENQKGENQKGTNQDGQQGSSPHERQPNGQEATGTDSSQSQGGKSTEKSVTKKQSSGSNGSQKGPAEKSDGAGSQGSRKTDRPQSGGDQQQSTSEKTTSSEQKDKQKSGADDKQPGSENETEQGKGTERGKEGTEKGTASAKEKEGTRKENYSEKQPGASDQGKSGSGQKNDGKTGTGKKSAQGDPGQEKQPDSGSSRNGEPPPPNESERTSDSKGQQSGDRSGGGKKGPGQGSNQAGKDNAGSNTPSDEGAGAANEPGAGEKSSSPGKQQPSATPTGSQGNEKGPGSQASPNDGKSSSKTPGKSPPSNEKQKQDPRSEPGTSGNPGDASGNQQNPTGGGPGDVPTKSSSSNQEAPLGDDPNLEYTRRATDFVLEALKDQKDKPDEKLLEDLGWSAEDLRAFVDRWQKLKQAAAEDPVARRELDEALRGLGLRPQKDSKRTGTARSDDQRGLRETGIKSAPPAAYQEQFNAFKKGAAKAK